MIDKSKIVFIGQSRGWGLKYIEKIGYTCKDSYKNRGFFFRIIREVFFRLRLPGKEFFYNKEVICDNKIFIIGEGLITYDYLEWLHKKCPSCIIILKYDNPVNPKRSPICFSDEWCIKWTFDKDDAKKYKMHLFNSGGYLPIWKVRKEEPIYDVFYIGKDKGRLKRLKEIEEELHKQNLTTLFYITWERSWQKWNDGIHKPFLPYEEVLVKLGKTKAILHLKEGAQNGITLRIQESLIHRIKLITDDVNIVEYDFYNPRNIFILGKDDLRKLKDFLNSPYEEVTTTFYEHAFFDDMVNEIIVNSIKDTSFITDN